MRLEDACAYLVSSLRKTTYSFCTILIVGTVLENT